MGLCDLSYVEHKMSCHARKWTGREYAGSVNNGQCLWLFFVFRFFKFYFEIAVALEKSYKNNCSLVPLTQHPPVSTLYQT